MSTSQPLAPGTLNEHARKWLEKLPEEIRPKVLNEQFPRIINRISSLWLHPEELMEYLDELLVDTRGGRAGFPMAVATEIVNIKDFYEMNLHPDSKAYLWDPRRRDEQGMSFDPSEKREHPAKDDKDT
jgi:hypothetical protein